MTKDEALKMALEALEWSYGGEPMPTKEIEAINAIRQVLSQPDRSPTVGYAKKIEQLIKERDELRQALAEWTPDDTAYRPDGMSQDELPPVKSYCGGKPNYCEPEMDKQCSSCGGFCGEVCERENVVEPVAWIFQHEETGLTECVDAQQVEWGFEKNNPRWQKIAPLYTAPPKLWVTLSDDEIAQAVGSPLDEVYLADFRKVEAKLMEKNNAKPNQD